MLWASDEMLKNTPLPALVKFHKTDIGDDCKKVLAPIIKQRLLCEPWPICEAKLKMAGEADIELPEALVSTPTTAQSLRL